MDGENRRAALITQLFRHCVRVDRCAQCPFVEKYDSDAHHSCTHPAIAADENTDTGARLFDGHSSILRDPPPSWCPLQTQSVLVVRRPFRSLDALKGIGV